MSTITIRVPVQGNDPRCHGWSLNVSEHIDAGNGVEFVDDVDGTTPVNIGHLHLDTEGSVSFYGKGYDSSAAVSMTFAAGGFHVVPGMHGIQAAGTSTGAGIHVKV